MLLEKLNLVKRALKKMEKNHCSLSVSFPLSQKKLERVRKELKEENLLIENFPEAAKTTKRSGDG